MNPGQKLSDTEENTGLNIQCGAKKIFYRYRSPLDGKVKQLTLGHFASEAIKQDLLPELGKKKLTLSAAREILQQLKLQRKAGICPQVRSDKNWLINPHIMPPN